jgi:hypothetical protein
MTETKNRKTRRYPRVISQNLLSVRPLSGDGEAETVTTSKVVGLGGVMFESERRYPVGRKLEMTILAGTELVKILVKVAWCNKGEGGRWQVGVEFQDITDAEQNKILDLLMRRISLEEEISD